jgi:NAD(P)-dependent dehydrogenase (short-subunit alcohol dehydrogenase family)
VPWSVAGRTILITGATSGIGLEAAVALARLGAQVSVVGRSEERIATARQEIQRRSGVDVHSYICDFASQSAIRKLAAEVIRDCARLDVLVNNAGGVNNRRSMTGDGVERTFATNHLGYFLLTNLLLGLIKRSAPARIVSVSSIGHRRGTLDFDDLNFDHERYGIMKAYCRSKLANVLFSNELARRLAGSGVTSNSLHPGRVATNIWSGAPLWSKPLIALLLRPTFITAEAGSKTIVHLAASPEVEGVTGRYFEDNKESTPAPTALDDDAGRRLWKVSERLVGLESAP